MGRRSSGIGRRIDNIAKWLLAFRVIAAPARLISNSWLAWSFVSRLDRIRVKRQLGRIRMGEMPQHVSIIMDGNRRFAWSLSLGREFGHRHGKEKLKEVMDWILDLGIPYLTVYALSTENITSREPEELESLYDLYVTGLQEISEDPRIHSKKVNVRVAGRIEILPERVREAISHAEERTVSYSDFTFTVCLAYGGREEIVDAVKGVAADHASGDLELDEIDNLEISNRLYDAQIPDPDLMIRTSGEERVSNFLLWQMAYAEFYFTDVHWPSFSKGDLYDAIETYQIRRRRYGG
ncbi:MAG: polyprenyl diphosphate synthase [Candidatus Thalassarchaeaceae archaeon]|jgi:tritrans,polycis-undecaprenyl-diphosphate synthase [geranylgeranyl-diphosphate specific]|nr:di-trans,poly-cis-decaprenylcistransferase [Euryarchaeota archaeon]MDP7091827.1 polyprenyl diphosphate synthase [Candidatus Thalassarchaeaceae archaeon]MDP7256484.1 polyprenyl diphosphate synthase [Candidatus Thalassarchaeaceae archaeon]MDP7445874.1 polyprenyl diphosphate synthase [Candidatus Thalassarchaeaceae archaeon]MDP7648848.1 polyprenyl diphosphate synthase [Candidatus Thalassarchaeaceae archaeon]